MEKCFRIHAHADPDQHQKLITSRRSPFVHAYHIWSMSVTAIMSYPAQRQNDRTNKNTTAVITS